MDNFFSPDLIKAKFLIDALDLKSTIKRLIKIEKWKESHAIKACEQYKKFLFLKKKYGDSYELPPSSDIDEAWHAHILHTRDYSQFCQQVFGSYLHHDPHQGEDGTISEQQLADMFKSQTLPLYYKENGEHLTTARPLPFKIILKRLIKVIFKRT